MKNIPDKIIGIIPKPFGQPKNGGGKPDVIAHAHDKICKVTLTIADLAINENTQLEHIAQTISYRRVERKL